MIKIGNTVKCIEPTMSAYGCEGIIEDIVTQGEITELDDAFLRVNITVGNELNPANTQTTWYIQMVELV